MTKKSRSIILILGGIIFFIITPYIVLYSLGYRVDLKKFKIVATGGIYVKALPEGVNITIDSKNQNTTNLLFYSVFQQNLLPGQHSVAIKKAGYFDYQKNLGVTENQVTKLEHVVLIKKDIAFSSLDTGVDDFYVPPDGKNLIIVKTTGEKTVLSTISVTDGQKNSISLSGNNKISDITWSSESSKAIVKIKNDYFLLQPFLTPMQITALSFLSGAKQALFNPQNTSQIFYIKNKNLYLSGQLLPVIKNVATFQIANNTLTYLAYDGFLYRYDIASQTTDSITLQAFPVNTNSTYALTVTSNAILLKADTTLLILNQKSQSFEKLYEPINNLNISPDGQKLLYYNDHEILYSFLNVNPVKPVFLNRFSDQIGSVWWLNNDYVVLNVGNKIIISEIDVRGNVNMVQLPWTTFLPVGKTINAAPTNIFFDQQNKKLYILAGNNLVSSEQLIP